MKRIAIDKAKSESPAYGGKSFGSVGQYEKLVGHAYGELDPKDPHNSIITDIQLAPRNAHGMVEYVATFTLFKPVDMGKASNVLIYDVVNRGRKLEQVGSDRGYSYLFSGWQGDIPENSGPAGREPETIQVPVAHNADGSTITGPVLARFMNIEGNTSPLMVYSRPVPYLPATLDTTKAKLISSHCRKYRRKRRGEGRRFRARIGPGRIAPRRLSRASPIRTRFASRTDSTRHFCTSSFLRRRIRWCWALASRPRAI